MCVKYAGSLGAGVMFEAGAFTSQERFTSLLFCLVCRDVRSQWGASESLASCRQFWCGALGLDPGSESVLCA